MTSHKPTSIRNKPEYIMTAAAGYLYPSVDDHDSFLEKFLEDLAICWVYVWEQGYTDSKGEKDYSLIPKLSPALTLAS